MNWSFQSDFVFLFSHACSVPCMLYPLQQPDALNALGISVYFWIDLCVHWLKLESVIHLTLIYFTSSTFFPFQIWKGFLWKGLGPVQIFFLLWILLIVMSESSMILKILYGCIQTVPHRQMWGWAMCLTQGTTATSIPPFPTGVFWGEVYKRVLERGDRRMRLCEEWYWRLMWKWWQARCDVGQEAWGA